MVRMYVLVDDEAPRVREADDFRRLHVSAPGLEVSRVGEVLLASGFGHVVDAGNVQLDVAALRKAVAEAATLPDWAAQWDGMIGYAAKQGWLSEDGTYVQVHIVSE